MSLQHSPTFAVLTRECWGQGALLLVLFHTSHAVEHALTARARGGLGSLAAQVPAVATVVDAPPGGGEPDLATARTLAAADVAVGQLMLVRPGEQVRPHACLSHDMAVHSSRLHRPTCCLTPSLILCIQRMAAVDVAVGPLMLLRLGEQERPHPCLSHDMAVHSTRMKASQTHILHEVAASLIVQLPGGWPPSMSRPASSCSCGWARQALYQDPGPRSKSRRSALQHHSSRMLFTLGRLRWTGRWCGARRW